MPAPAASAAPKTTAPTPSASRRIQATPAVKSALAKTPKKAPDASKLSADAKKEATAAVKTEPYKKGNVEGRNSTLEGMLRNQGYDLKEIYAKGPDGKTLLQRTQADNGIKDATRMRDGQEFHIPRKPGATTTDNARPGQPSAATVTNGANSITNTATVNENGKQMETRANEVTSTTEVPPDGKVVCALKPTADGNVTSGCVARNNDNSAVTNQQTTATNEGVGTQIRDADKNPNLRVNLAPDQTTVVNQGSQPGGDVKTTLTAPPPTSAQQTAASLDGWLGRTTGGWLGRVDAAPLSVDNASGLDQFRAKDGSVTSRVKTADGPIDHATRGADGFLQRFTRWLGW